MKYDLLHIQGKPYVLVPLHDYRALTNEDKSAGLPNAVLDQLAARQQSAVKTLRKHRGLTQAELARKAGLSRPYLTEIEAGKKDGSVKAIKSIAKVLGVNTGLLT